MATDPSFRMTIADVFSIRGRGTVVTGRIESGILQVGDDVYIQGQTRRQQTVVTGIETFRKQLEQASMGDNVGVLLQNVAKDDVQPGDVLVGSAAGAGEL
jgi:elongation factor Tu